MGSSRVGGAMWTAHSPAAVIDTPCARNSVHNVGRGRNGTRARRAGDSVKMAGVGGTGVARCRDVTPQRNSRLACAQEYVILVPFATRCSHSSTCSFPLNLRFRVRKGRSSRQVRRWNVSLDSPKDGAEGSEEEEKEVPANSLEFTHKVALDVLAPPDLVWKLWTDIKSAPQWMRWIDRVDFLDEEDSTDLPPGLSRLSRWICSTIGFEVMWVARVEHVESNLPVRVLRWATVEGLPSRGEVTFKENHTKGTTVELSISHSLPAALGRVMQSSALRGLVQATLQTDLECFQKYAAEAVNQQLERVTTEEDGGAERKGSLTITTDCSQNLCDSL